MSDLPVLLDRLESGDSQASVELLPLVYEELRKLAAWQLSQGGGGPTLQATALVHEAWLRLGGEARTGWQSRSHFVAAAAQAMRHILIDRARQRQAVRHGGGLQRLDLDQLDVADPSGQNDQMLLAVNDALDRLAAQDPAKAELVKLRFFVGLTLKEAARILEISEPTAQRSWAYARAWLASELEP